MFLIALIVYKSVLFTYVLRLFTQVVALVISFPVRCDASNTDGRWFIIFAWRLSLLMSVVYFSIGLKNSLDLFDSVMPMGFKLNLPEYRTSFISVKLC